MNSLLLDVLERLRYIGLVGVIIVLFGYFGLLTFERVKFGGRRIPAFGVDERHHPDVVHFGGKSLDLHVSSGLGLWLRLIKRLDIVRI